MSRPLDSRVEATTRDVRGIWSLLPRVRGAVGTRFILRTRSGSAITWRSCSLIRCSGGHLTSDVLAFFAFLVVGTASGSTPGPDTRLSNDCSGCGGYVSAYTLATGSPYTDQTLQECSVSRGRQNEPAVAVDPRDTSVVLGSSNDYCGVYNRGAAAGAVGPVWLGYYRSQDGGSN